METNVSYDDLLLTAEINKSLRIDDKLYNVINKVYDKHSTEPNSYQLKVYLFSFDTHRTLTTENPIKKATAFMYINPGEYIYSEHPTPGRYPLAVKTRSIINNEHKISLSLSPTVPSAT